MISELDMMHGGDWTDDIDPAGWIVSEKLNGCRAFWDGSQLWSRGGNVIPAPAWFTAGLPTSPLDGEVWAGRGQLMIHRPDVDRYTPGRVRHLLKVK